MVRWGIIGLGNIAKRFAKSLEYEKDGKLVAVAGKTENKRMYFKEAYKDVKVYESYDELFNNQDIDAVYIALPHRFHAKWSIRGLNKGKAILCEKPSTLNSSELGGILKCAKRNKTFYMEAMKTPFVPMFDLIKDVLKSGVIGDIKCIYAGFCSKPNVDKNSYLYNKEDGGAVLDVASYPIAFVLGILNDKKILSINKKIKKKKFDEVSIDVHFEASIKFEGDVTANIEGGIDGEKERTAIIEGTLGKMYIPIFNRPESYKVILNDGREYEEKLSLINDDMYGEIHEVHKCLALGKIESDIFTWNNSIEILKIIDHIRDINKYS